MNTLDAFEHNCYVCNSTEKLCIDHHRPLSKGHALTLDNAVVLCDTCNKKKHDKSPEEFYGLEKCAELDKKLAGILEEHKDDTVKGSIQEVSTPSDKPLEI